MLLAKNVFIHIALSKILKCEDLGLGLSFKLLDDLANSVPDKWFYASFLEKSEFGNVCNALVVYESDTATMTTDFSSLIFLCLFAHSKGCLKHRSHRYAVDQIGYFK